MKIYNTEVSNLAKSIIASSYPMMTDYDPDKVGKEVCLLNNFIFHRTERDFDSSNISWCEDQIKRASKLGRVKDSKGNPQIGKGHDCFLKGIKVAFDMRYPLYLSRQMQRYTWFEFVSSSSTMHRIHATPLAENCNKYVDKAIINIVQDWIDMYNKFDEELDYVKHLKPENCDKSVYANAFKDMVTIDSKAFTKYDLLMKVMSNLPQGYELVAGMETSYMQLKTMYLQRRNHKLKEDWGYFCTWCESLPLFKEFCLKEKTND